MRCTPGRFDGIHVVVAQRHEEHLFAEAPDFVTAVFFRRAEDSEVLAGVDRESRAVARPIA